MNASSPADAALLRTHAHASSMHAAALRPLEPT